MKTQVEQTSNHNRSSVLRANYKRHQFWLGIHACLTLAGATFFTLGLLSQQEMMGGLSGYAGNIGIDFAVHHAFMVGGGLVLVIGLIGTLVCVRNIKQQLKWQMSEKAPVTAVQVIREPSFENTENQLLLSEEVTMEPLVGPVIYIPASHEYPVETKNEEVDVNQEQQQAQQKQVYEREKAWALNHGWTKEWSFTQEQVQQYAHAYGYRYAYGDDGQVLYNRHRFAHNYAVIYAIAFFEKGQEEADTIALGFARDFENPKHSRFAKRSEVGLYLAKYNLTEQQEKWQKAEYKQAYEKEKTWLFKMMKELNSTSEEVEQYADAYAFAYSYLQEDDFAGDREVNSHNFASGSIEYLKRRDTEPNRMTLQFSAEREQEFQQEQLDRVKKIQEIVRAYRDESEAELLTTVAKNTGSPLSSRPPSAHEFDDPASSPAMLL